MTTKAKAKAKAKARSRILEAVHETATDLHRLGFIDKRKQQKLEALRWPTSTAVAGSMIGEIGALGGGLVPMLMGQSKQNTDSFLTGFIVLAVFSVLMLGVMRKMQVRWTRTWAEKGGRARSA